MKYILFDLDATLYYLDEEKFLNAYFEAIGKKAIQLGYDFETAVKALYHGSKAMSTGDGSLTNEQLFWGTFEKIMGKLPKDKKEAFDVYYENEFNDLKVFSKPVEEAKNAVKVLKEKGYSLVVATNPVLPITAQYQRIKWAELDKDDFALITTFETFHFTKPFPTFYKEVMEKLHAKPEECLMVGNDVRGDILAAQEAGIKTFLITRQVFNFKNDDYSNIPQGDFSDLLKYIDSLK